MKVKYLFLAVLGVLLILSINSTSSGAVDASEIVKVREKDILTNSDREIIDTFIGEEVRGLVNASDFSTVSRHRSPILLNSRSKKAVAQRQYSTQFSESSYRHLSQAFTDAEAIQTAERKYRVVLNLLILVDGLRDVRLTELAAEKLVSTNAVIQYWAVHCVSNQDILEQLNSNPERLKLARNIAEHLKGLIADADSEVMALILRFARGINIADGRELLVQIADVRISKYANWDVDYELLDSSVLRGLYEKISTADDEEKRVFGRRFAHLFSYIIQRYVKGSMNDYLTDLQKQHLTSVLVEVERSCISNLLGQAQVVIRRALEGDNKIGLLQEHSRLLGDKTRPGVLPTELDFDYGNNNGSTQTAPPDLPAPPVKQVPEEQPLPED